METDEFKQFITWFKNVLKARMPAPVQKDLEQIIDQSNPWEVEEMITNIELAIEAGQKQALEKGMEKGMETKALEAAKNLMAMGMGVEKVQQATGLTKEEIEKLRPIVS